LTPGRGADIFIEAMKEVPISQVDALFVNGRYPIEFLFYYRDPIPTERVRGALRSLAPDFWPAFGQYADGVILFDRYREESCFDEEVVERDLELPEIEAGGLEAISRFRQKGSDRLFFLKAIRFRNGSVLIPRLEHAAGDGYSYFVLLSALAAISRPSRIPFRSSFVRSMFRPHHRRTALKAFSFQGAEAGPDIRGGSPALEVQEIPRKDVRELIDEAGSTRRLRLSSNDVLSAMVVKKLVSIRREGRERTIGLTIPIDVRNKIGAYGRRFFGNGIMLHKVDLERARIETAPLLDIAAQIRNAMPAVSSESYVDYLEKLERTIAEKDWDRFRPFDPESGCLVTNLSKLPAERLDFGAGFPRAIVPLTIEKNSAGILARNGNYVLRTAT
jgi:hypothetical protein